MEKKVEVKLMVHPTDYAIAMNAARLLKTSIEDFCLMALVRRASEEIRLAELQPGTEVVACDVDAGEFSISLLRMLQLVFPDRLLPRSITGLSRASTDSREIEHGHK